MQKSILLFVMLISQISFAQISDEFKKNIKQRVDGGHAASIVVGTIDESGTNFFSYGKTTFKDGKSVDENSIYEIGSISKVFTSLVLAEMVDRGDMHLDDPIERHLPKGTKVPEYDGTKITMRHLATHSSGLPYMPTNFDVAEDSDNPFVSYDEKALLEFLNNYKLPRRPGEDYEYSNYAVGLLGYILSAKNNMSYEQMIQSFICEKWEMENTVLKFSEAQKEKVAIGHSGKAQTSNWDFDALAGAGAIRSNVNDMLQFLTFQMGLKESKMKSAIEMSQQLYFPKGGGVGLGWHFFRDHHIWHNGGTGGYRSFAGFDPDKKRGIVLFTNGNDGVDDLGFHWLDETFPLNKFEPMLEVNAEDMKSYIGKYDLMGIITFTVTEKEEQLLVHLTNQPTNPVFAKAKDKFFYKGIDAQITFNRDESGKVISLTLHQNGMDQEAKRVE